MNVTLQQLTDLVRGRLTGDPDCPITAARPLHQAGPGDITFLESEKHLAKLLHSKASAAVIPAGVTPASLAGAALSVIRTDDPLGAFVSVVRHLHGEPQPLPTGIDPRAAVHPSAVIGPDACVQPFAVIGAGTRVGARCQIHAGVVIGRECVLGDDVTIYPNAVVYDRVVIGQRTIVHANAVLGADGFGYRFSQGRHVKVPQLGTVELGNDVEVGAATAIDRGTFQVTRIGDGTKIDNLVQIGHNCEIGRHNLLVSQMGIGGSSSTVDYVVIAGQVGIADHVHIGDKAVLGARSGVPSDVPAGERVLGAPATPEREQKRILLTMAKLPEMRKDIQAIKHLLKLDDQHKAAS